MVDQVGEAALFFPPDPYLYSYFEDRISTGCRFLLPFAMLIASFANLGVDMLDNDTLEVSKVNRHYQMG